MRPSLFGDVPSSLYPVLFDKHLKYPNNQVNNNNLADIKVMLM